MPSSAFIDAGLNLRSDLQRASACDSQRKRAYVARPRSDLTEFTPKTIARIGFLGMAAWAWVLSTTGLLFSIAG